MDQKRFLLFIVLSMGVLIGWNAFVMPRFLPPKKPNAVAQKEPDKKAAGERLVADKPAAGRDKNGGDKAAEKPAAETDDEKAPAVADEGESDKPAADGDADGDKEPEKPPVAAKVAKFPEKTVELGAPDIAS